MVNLSGIVGLSGGTGDTFPTQVYISISGLYFIIQSLGLVVSVFDP